MIAKCCHDVNTDRESVVNPRHIVTINITFWSSKNSRKTVFMRSASATIKRCSWVTVDDPLMLQYHDCEWGVPVHDERPDRGVHRMRDRQRWWQADRQSGDDGTNDLVVSEVLRTNELQVWFLSEHLVDVPLVKAQEPSSDAGAA